MGPKYEDKVKNLQNLFSGYTSNANDYSRDINHLTNQYSSLHSTSPDPSQFIPNLSKKLEILSSIYETYLKKRNYAEKSVGEILKSTRELKKEFEEEFESSTNDDIATINAMLKLIEENFEGLKNLSGFSDLFKGINYQNVKDHTNTLFETLINTSKAIQSTEQISRITTI